MDTNNTVITASGQEKLHFDNFEKILSISTEADLMESDTSSVRSETKHTQLDVTKQEPMSVDSAPPNNGKDVSFKPSDSVTTTVSSSQYPAAPLGSAPVRWSKPKRVYSQELLRSQLNPILTSLWSCEPDAAAFRYPVDTIALGIPEYVSIVPYPMDLSTISQRLARGDYQCPWLFIDDIWLMFNNAWLFNRRNTKVYESCTKLSEVYEKEIAPVIQELGLCCGKKYDYSPQFLYCSSKNICPINRYDYYWNYQDWFNYCQKCYSELEGEVIRLPDGPNTAVRKDEFKKRKNDYLDAEPFIDCRVCLRRFHQVCVLYVTPLFPNGFTCQNCLNSQPDVPLELTQRKSARQLPHYDISSFIEERVHELLRQKECNEDVFIRLVSTGENTMKLKPRIKERYWHNPPTFPYHSKALFAFEMIDNEEVCFYGMHVEGYEADCPEPNRKRVCISYLDSVFFFRPKQLRTDVYHEILISYLEYCKREGYLYAHIWVCPPSERDDYIFHCHPVEQKTPNLKQLQEWYKAMFEKAIERRVVVSYTNIYNCFIEHGSNPISIPYFEGDFWPDIIEDFIREIDEKEQERKQHEGCKATENKKNPTPRNFEGKCTKSNGDDVIQKISNCAEKYRESFFVIKIQEDCGISKFKETDYSVRCDLMEGRVPFLALARERHLEFSSLRRIKYSTLALAYELHNRGYDRFIYTCSYCSRHVESRYHCNTCEDFDLCEECSKQNTHEHPLELWRGEEEENGGNQEANQQQSPQQILQRRIQTLLHTLQCKNQDLCRNRNCAFMKKLSIHATKHMQYNSNTCTYCHNFFTLIHKHAKTCMDPKCNVPFCARLKQKLSEQNRVKRKKFDIMYRRNMRNMSSPVVPATPPKPVLSTSNNLRTDEHTAVTPNLPSVNSTQPPIVPSLMESPAEQLTTQGSPLWAGRQNCKLNLA